jgi:predicted ribosomally synthesized peptide with nif11-like leader
MSVKAALHFIQRLGDDPDLRQQVRASRIDGDLRRMVELASRIGLEFTVDELRQAHRVDWSMRRMYYGAHKLSPGD